MPKKNTKQQDYKEEQKKLEEACAEFEAGWKRALADYKNLQKDMEAQLAASRTRIKVQFAESLMPVLDNFQQAVAHAPDVEKKELKNWLQGVLFIEKQFEDVLSGLGLEKIEATDEFDPNLHESVGEGDTFKQIKPGWKIDEHVVRPAQVIVKKES